MRLRQAQGEWGGSEKALLIAIVNQRIINAHKEAYFIVSDMQKSDLTRYKLMSSVPSAPRNFH